MKQVGAWTALKWMSEHSGGRGSISVSARLEDGDRPAIRVRLENRSAEPVVIVGLGLRRIGDPASEFRHRTDLPRAVPPDGSHEIVLDPEAVARAAPIDWLETAMELPSFLLPVANVVFAELRGEARPIVTPLPPDVREALRARRSRLTRPG